MDVFSNINRGIEETFNDASVHNVEYKGNLKFRINVSSQKIEKSTSNNTSSLLEESHNAEKELFTSTLSESVFQSNHNSTFLDKSMDFTKKTNISKMKSPKAKNEEDLNPKTKEESCYQEKQGKIPRMIPFT